MVIYYCSDCYKEYGIPMYVIEIDDRIEWRWVKLKCPYCGKTKTIKEDRQKVEV